METQRDDLSEMAELELKSKDWGRGLSHTAPA
jgi:hypothetical protein